MLAVLAALGGDAKAAPPSTNLLDSLAVLASATGDDNPAAEPEAATDTAACHEEAPKKSTGAPPPLPFHCVEGYSGGLITPMAYLCNAEERDGCPDWLGAPSVAYTFLNLGSKKMHVFSVTQPFLKRFEFGYAYNNLDTGSLYRDVRKAGLNMGERHVGLHHFNLRGMLLDENSFDLPLPALTAGIHFKYNDAIDDIDQNLGGALSSIGYDDDFAVDYTLTATKMFPKLALGRPVLLTGGLRLSKAAQLGLLGFGNKCKASFEGSVAYLPLDQLCLAYEYRMKQDPYNELPGLVENEDDWHAFSASWIFDDHLTVTGVFGTFGNIANATADCVVGLQLKYEF